MAAFASSWLQWAFLGALLFLSGMSCEEAEAEAPAPYHSTTHRLHHLRAFHHDARFLQVSLNLEFLEAEFFLFAVYGYGLDIVNASLAQGGPPPIGGQKANLDDFTTDLIAQFGLQEVGHVRAIKETLGRYFFSRPQLNISKEVFATFFDAALGEKLDPPFDVYANSVNYLLGVYIIPYVGLTGYVGAAPHLLTPVFKRGTAGLLGVEAGQDAVTRLYLYERKDEKVAPYDYTVEYFTNKISEFRNNLSAALVDEGLTVPVELSAGAGILEPSTKLVGNILAGDNNSLSYARTPAQIFSTVYSTGDPSKPGGFYPKGANGIIAQELLHAD